MMVEEIYENGVSALSALADSNILRGIYSVRSPFYCCYSLHIFYVITALITMAITISIAFTN